MASPLPQASSSSQIQVKRQRTLDMDQDLVGNTDNRAKRLRPSDPSLDEMKHVVALLEADDNSCGDCDDVVMGLHSPSPLLSLDKGKQRMVGESTTQSATAATAAGHIAGGDSRNSNLKVVSELEVELSCGCCAALVHRPMILQPCQHFFCTSCLKLWIQNANSNSCPECRTPCTHATASRTIQSIVDLLTRNRPDLQRTENERQQADEICPPCAEIKMPQPKPPNPDILIPQSRSHDLSADNLARPCPHCLPQNQFGWRCPRPIPDPESDPDHAWNLDIGPPPGHGFCGACSEIHPLNAPGTSACSLCRTSFCGLSIPHLCIAPSIRSSRLPHSLNTLTGLLEAHSESIWEAMEFNEVEIEILLDWLRDGRYGAIRTVYQEMLEHAKNSQGFEAMIREGIFASDQNNVNSLPLDTLRAPSAPSVPAPPGAGLSSSVLPTAAVQPASASFPLISPAETASNGGTAERTVTARRVDLEFPRFATIIPAAPPVLDGSQAVGSSSTGAVPSPPVRLRVSDLRFLFGFDAATTTGMTNSGSSNAQPAPLSSIPMEEEARLMPPITPISTAPLNTSFPTQSSRRPSNSIPSALPSEAAVLPALSSLLPPPRNSTSSSSSAASATANNASSTSNVNRICRDCAFELFLHELYPWWCRERARVLALMEEHPLPTATSTSSATAPDQGTSSVDSISDAAARANIDLLVASSHFTSSMGELLVDDGDDVGDEDSDDEGYTGEGIGQNGDRRGDIVIVGGNRNNSASQQRLTSRLPEWVGSRPNCPDGRRCGRQKEMTHAKEFNHIISDATPVAAPSASVVVAPSQSARPPPPPVSSILTANVAVPRLVADERDDGEAERIEQMEVDTVNQLTGFFTSFDDGTSSADTLMHDVMTLGTAASSNSDNEHPHVDQLLPSEGTAQPSGPIITPSAEVQSVIFNPAAAPGPGAGPLLKQQATANEVLLDMALIRTGMGIDSPLAYTQGGSDASASSSSSSSSSSTSGPTLSFSSQEPSEEHSGYPGPSVEIVSNMTL